MMSPKEVLKNFDIMGAIESIALFGGGHINDTYHVKTSKHEYLLQRINTTVFQDVAVMESNLDALFSSKSQILVEHIPSSNGSWIWQSGSEAWKVQVFDGSVYAPEFSEDKVLVGEVARGFGKFLSMNRDLSVDQFRETIPQFHDLEGRLAQLDEALDKNLAGRIDKAAELIERANNFRWVADRMNALKAGGLPQRVCHNDTKIDNILLSRATNAFQRVIDLDTVGPGYALYDFGDMMRTMLSPTKESEPDESKVVMRQEYLEVIKQHFREQTDHLLTEIEKESLTFGGVYMTYMMGIRFLADYLNGDVYYKISRPDENYIRARNQLRLLELMKEKHDL